MWFLAFRGMHFCRSPSLSYHANPFYFFLPSQEQFSLSLTVVFLYVEILHDLDFAMARKNNMTWDDIKSDALRIYRDENEDLNTTMAAIREIHGFKAWYVKTI